MNALVGLEAKANFSLFGLIRSKGADDGSRKDGGDFASTGAGAHLRGRGEFDVLHDGYMDASRLPRTIRVCWGRSAAVLYPACGAGIDLLALRESADPRLILRKDSKSIPSYRLGGSRSDLFAITLLSTLRNLYGGHSFHQSG